ncbi:MAG: ATP translocase [Kangiellaceae bacterium]|nr:ATP translocase [Kangiellaceae bacterium]
METASPNSHNWYERILNIISVVKPYEGKSTVLLTANACVLLMGYYLLKVIREPLILAYGGAEYKSYATAAQAAILSLSLPFLSALYHRNAANKKRSNMTNKVTLFFISNLLVFAGLQYLGINIGMIFYIWLGIFSVMVLAQFWAFAADCFNVRCGQRLFVIIAVGASFGAWIGSRIAGPLYPQIGIVGIILLVASLLLLSIYLTSKVEGVIPQEALNDEPVKKESGNQWLDGFAVVFKSPYLFKIAIFVMLLVFINSTGEYILARLVSQQSDLLIANQTISDASLWQNQFYSDYYSWITLGSFAIQLFLVSRLFKWLGLRGSILVLPVIMIIGYGLMLFFPIFSLIRVLMAAENSANYSVQNTTKHALFLPVPRKLKYLGKTTIDTFFFRFGDLLYGGFIYVGTQFFDMSISHFIICNLVLAVVLFILAWKVGHSNILEVQKTQGNSPPEVKALLPNLRMPTGQLSKFSISECTFVDPDIGDALKFEAKLESGAQLPSWMKFDRISRTFSFKPPEKHIGEYSILVTATDFEGLTASTHIHVSFYHADTNKEE